MFNYDVPNNDNYKSCRTTLNVNDITHIVTNDKSYVIYYKVYNRHMQNPGKFHVGEYIIEQSNPDYNVVTTFLYPTAASAVTNMLIVLDSFENCQFFYNMMF